MKENPGPKNHNETDGIKIKLETNPTTARTHSQHQIQNNLTKIPHIQIQNQKPNSQTN